MNVEKLRGEMYSKKITVEKLCQLTGIERTRMYRRLNSSGYKMTLEEAKKIATALELPHEKTIEIFLT